MDKILDANDYAKCNNYLSLREMLKARNYQMFDTPFLDTGTTGKSVTAFVSFGFWIARCECNGAEYVAPGEPFYCQSCGNYENGGQPRPVIFPEDKQQIEDELLRRPIMHGTGRNIVERTQRQRAVIQTEKGWLSRTWLPEETLDDIKEQNKILPRKKRR